MISLLFCCVNILLFASDLDSLYLQVKNRFAAIKTLQADVSQTNDYIQSKAKLQSVGKLYYKPGNLVLDYSKPSIQKLIIKGNNVLVYDKDSKSVIKTTNSIGISNPLQIVDKYWENSSRQLISEDSISMRIRILPQKDEQMKKIEVKFDTRAKLLKELAYWDNAGNMVKYKFQNIRINTTIPSTKWNFTVPKGVKVIQR